MGATAFPTPHTLQAFTGPEEERAELIYAPRWHSCAGQIRPL
jgi:hypothetical protein